MTILTYVFAFLIAIGVLVAVHEFGHFWAARRLGIRVVRFSIGFGRPLWRRRAAIGRAVAAGCGDGNGDRLGARDVRIDPRRCELVAGLEHHLVRDRTVFDDR